MREERRARFEKITSAYLYLMLTVFVLYCGTEGYQAFQSAKYGAFMLLCGGYLLAMLLCALALICSGDLRLPKPRDMLRRLGWVQRLILLYMLLTWLSALVSPYFPQTIRGVSRNEGALTISVYCLCFLLVSVFGRPTKAMLFAFSAAVLVFCCVCILQLQGLDPLGLYPAGMNYFDAYTKYSGAYLGTTGNVDLTAAFLCLAIPVLSIALVRLRGGARWGLCLPLAGALYVLVRMSVLAGFVGVVVGGAICLPAVLPCCARTRRILACSIAAAAVIALVLIFLIDFESGLFYELHELLHGNQDERFGSGRIYIWKNVLRRIPARLLIGHGPDSMLYGGIEAFTRYDSTLGRTLVSQIDVAHNEYLNILYHQGAAALGAYLAALVLCFVRALRASRGDPIAAILLGAFVCYLVQAFFSFSMCITAPLFWLAFGLLEKQAEGQNRGRIK